LKRKHYGIALSKAIKETALRYNLKQGKYKESIQAQLESKKLKRKQ
jgi:hypothetical protein